MFSLRKGALSLIVLFSFLPNAFSCDEHGTTGIVEENDLYISVDAKNTSNVTEKEFNDLLDRIESLYAPIIEAKGKTLVVNRKWQDGTVNAYAQQSGNQWMISMFGGLARHEAITADGFALVACHELGHHLGGAPKKKSWFSTTWATNEGQADYFGTAKCLRKYMEHDDNLKIVSEMEVPEMARKKCETNFNTENEVAICIRGAMAGLSLGNVFKELRKLSHDLKFSTPDTKIVAKTFHGHPEPQCRLDTYFAGSICEKDAYDDVSVKDLTKGTCNREEGHIDGLRPFCWFNPKDAL